MRITKIHILRFLKSVSHFVATVSIYKTKLVNSSGKSVNTGLSIGARSLGTWLLKKEEIDQKKTKMKNTLDSL